MSKIIAVDFDGTLCEYAWPRIGEPNKELISYLLNEQKTGTKLILWTCRVGEKLWEAVCWCSKHGLVFDAINDNVQEAITMFGGDSRKVYADIYIDDHASTDFTLPFRKGTNNKNIPIKEENT